MTSNNQNNNVQVRFDQDAQNFTPSQAAGSTIYEPSLCLGDGRSRFTRTVEDDESRASLYSYHSHMDSSRFLKQLEGRTFNAQNDTYFLPTDDDEWTRLNKQHVAFLIGLGGLYPNPEAVRAQLAPVPGETKRILDLGCGTGIWITAMAREFPHAEAVGVDLAPSPVDADSLPRNCRFEIDDINGGLAHFAGKFDVVQARLIGSGLANYRKSMDDIQSCLKPGGIVIYFDGDITMLCEDQYTYATPAVKHEDGTVEGSWFQRLISSMEESAIKFGSDFPGMAKELDAGLWEHSDIDSSTCATASLFFPLGPWVMVPDDVESTQSLQYAGALLRQDFVNLHRAVHPLIKKLGTSQETLDEWSALADKELSSLSHPLWVRFRLAWGRRISDVPFETLPPVSPTTRRYPEYHIYTTQEQSLAEAAKRNATKKSL